ncbi:hypothetical protein EI94DRAFT_1704617 [Lactarius quietus]|nr:hypothetical protein EI94DRAFT_1704617 [Lactarius quietus]
MAAGDDETTLTQSPVAEVLAWDVSTLMHNPANHMEGDEGPLPVPPHLATPGPIAIAGHGMGNDNDAVVHHSQSSITSTPPNVAEPVGPSMLESIQNMMRDTMLAAITPLNKKLKRLAVIVDKPSPPFDLRSECLPTSAVPPKCTVTVSAATGIAKLTYIAKQIHASGGLASIEDFLPTMDDITAVRVPPPPNSHSATSKNVHITAKAMHQQVQMSSTAAQAHLIQQRTPAGQAQMGPGSVKPAGSGNKTEAMVIRDGSLDNEVDEEKL